MFLHVSLILFTVGCWYPSMPCRSLGGSPGPHPGGKLRGLARGVSRPTPSGVSRPRPGGVSQHVLRQTPPQQMATAAGSTHPTGMHSLSQWSSLHGKNYSVVIYLTILPLYSRWLTINNTRTINVLIYNWPLFHTLKSLELNHSLSIVRYVSY